MKIKTSLLVLLTAFSLMKTQAQEVAISYEIEHSSPGQAVMSIYMQSLSDQEIELKAVNFSLAVPEGCVQIKGQQTIFSDVWTHYLEESSMVNQLDLSYNNWTYTNRWQYGIADPGLPETTSLIVPSNNQERLFVMGIELEGSCLDKVYLEQHSENRLNQMGDLQVRPIAWTVVHPRTEMELTEDLHISIFPVPTRNFVTVTWQGTRQVDYSYKLYNSLGQLAQEGIILHTDSNDQIIDLSAYAQGTYYLKLISHEATSKVSQVKLIKL